MKRLVCLTLITALVSVAAHAGGFLQTRDFTDAPPGPIPDSVLTPHIPIRWDDRCIPVEYSVNNTLDPLPNPLGEPFLTLAEQTRAWEQALEAWNEIPTSYIEMRITGETDNPGLIALDFVNELSFVDVPGLFFLGVSRSISLVRDTVFEDGEDLDGDGDGDVVAGLDRCRDADGDGDVEFPAGLYPAGTIVDNDVLQPARVVRWTVDDADVDDDFRSVDVLAVAVHEAGHSHGLSHSLIDQISDEDGTGATMYPFIDTSDRESELAQRTLAADDVAFSSLHYPEGSAATGLAALQPGDVAFDEAYGLIEGEVFHGVLDEPVAGASVSAIHRDTGEVVAAVYSGTTRDVFVPFVGGVVIDAQTNVLDGAYRLPVPKGTYEVALEAIDGMPVPVTSISPTARVGAALGQLDFPQERWHAGIESELELFPGDGSPVAVQPGATRSGVDFVTNRTRIVGNGESLGFASLATGPPGSFHARRIPAQDILAADVGHLLAVHSLDFTTFTLDASRVVFFSQALLTTGEVVQENFAFLDLEDPLARLDGFVAEQLATASFYVRDPVALGNELRRRIGTGEIDDVFLVLQMPTEEDRPDLPPFRMLTFLDPGVPGVSDSFFSRDGEVFFNFPFLGRELQFSLQVSEAP